MIRSIKPVRFGILVGLLGLLFGIGWAVYLVVGHESIHETLETIGAKAGQGAYIKAEGHGAEKIAAELIPEKKVHLHRDGSASARGQTPLSSPEEENKGDESMRGMMMQGGHHNNPVMALAHTRLVRGHLHAMGLGLLTILISILLAFTTIGERIKTAISVLTGLGGVIYPFAWVVMGFLTPALGPDGAQGAVIYIAGPGIGLVLLGVFTAIFSISRDIVRNKD